MGNDGSGWSMSLWPRHIDRTGQDKPGPTPSTVYMKRKKKKTHGQPKVRRDDKKFEAALIEAIGPKAAKRYMARKRREK